MPIINWKIYLPLSLTILIFSITIGFLVAVAFPDFAQQQIELLTEKFEFAKDAGSWEIFTFIFFNNTLIDLMAIGCFFLLGLAPFLLLTINGASIGLISSWAAGDLGYPIFFASIAPHGLLEIPAFLIASSVGFWLSVKFIKKILLNEPLQENLSYAIKLFFKIIMPLNFLAAIIETFITPLVASFFW